MGWLVLLMLVAATPAVIRIFNNVETNVDTDVDVDCCGDE
jgi:hypothetical protein